MKNEFRSIWMLNLREIICEPDPAQSSNLVLKKLEIGKVFEDSVANHLRLQRRSFGHLFCDNRAALVTLSTNCYFPILRRVSIC